MTAAIEGGEWSAALPGRTLPPGKTRYPFYRRLDGIPAPVWTGGKSRPHRDSIPDRPAPSQSLYRLSYPAHVCFVRISEFITIISLYSILQPRWRAYCAELTEYVSKFRLIFASEELIISYPSSRWNQLSTFVAEHLRTRKWALRHSQTSEHKDFPSRNVVLIDRGSAKKSYKL